MEIIIDFSGVPTNNPIAFGWWFFKTIGWIYPVFLFVYGLILFWQIWLRNNYRKQRKYMLLAIDIPKNNEQTPKAVENIFSHLAGLHQPLNFYHKWWFGEIPNSFSFEIVSLGGYIQFIIHFVEDYRDVIEAMIYAQYPDAEITEIEDYTKNWNLKFPRDYDKYNLVGTEIKLAKDYIYPVLTHTEFEDAISQELKDPMAAMLEALTRIGPGEEIWIQFVVTPADNNWGERAKPEIKKLIGAKGGGKKTFLDYVFEIPNIVIDAFNPAPADAAKNKRDEPPSLMLYLTQGEKDKVAAIEHKTSKLGFHTKIRWIYLAKNEVFSKVRGINGIYGSFKQFNDLGLNSFKPDKRIFTGAIVWFKNRRLIWRKNKILYRYKHRGHWLSPGDYGPILNTEELASLWHFPVLTVKAPQVKKTEAKKAEPPISLPTQILRPAEARESSAAKTTPPQNLPTS